MTRGEYALFMLMEWHINRYLIANTFKREDGYEKATEHLILCDLYLRYYYCANECEIMELNEELNTIHSDSQALTSYLNTVIEFPLNVLSGGIDYDSYAKKFFIKFIEICFNSLENLKQEK